MAQMGSPSGTGVDDASRADDVQDMVAESRNDSPSAAIPIPRGEVEDDEDLERAIGDQRIIPTGGHQNQSFRRSWRNMLSVSVLSGDTIWGGRSAPVDRNR